MIKDTDKRLGEEVHRARSERVLSLRVFVFLLWLCSPNSEPCTSGGLEKSHLLDIMDH